MGGDGGGRCWRAVPPYLVFGTAAVVGALVLASSVVLVGQGTPAHPHGGKASSAAPGGSGPGTSTSISFPAGSSTSAPQTPPGPGADASRTVARAASHGGAGSRRGAGAGGSSGLAGSGLGGVLGGWTNLLTLTQALFGGTASTWWGIQASVSWVASPADGLGGALKLTSTGNGGMWLMSGSPHGAGLAAAAPGSVYDASATVRTAGGALTVQPVLGFYDAGGAYLTSVWGQGMATSAGGWTPLAPVTALAPPRTAFVGLGLLVYSSSPGQAIYMERPALLGAPSPASRAVAGPLHTIGNEILQANGRPLVLRGAELYGLDASSTPNEVSASTVAAAKSWGADVMRVALGEQLWNVTSCAYDPAYVATIDRAVNWITAAGMVALLELQDSSVGLGCPAGSPHDMADVAGSVPFWSQVAARYAGNPLVAFDLFNEPHDISDAVWLSGGLITDVSGAVYDAAGMQQLYDAVRAAGAPNLVVVSGNNWGATVPSAPVHGSNIVYGVHVYTCPDAAPPSCATANPTDPSPILSNWMAAGAPVPVMVSEFGWPSQADGAYAANVISFATAHGWGWNAFAFDTDAPFGLTALDPATGVEEPTPSGMPVLAALAVAS